MYVRSIAFLFVAGFGNVVVAGEILSCVSPNGDVMYTNMACPSNTRAHHVSDYTPVPDSPQVSASESAAHEAAINSRLALEAAQRAEAAAYSHQAPAYEDYEPQAYHQYPDYNSYYPAYFGYGVGNGLGNNGFGRDGHRGHDHHGNRHTDAKVVHFDNNGSRPPTQIRQMNSGRGARGGGGRR
jgi:hypothetical protein